MKAHLEFGPPRDYGSALDRLPAEDHLEWEDNEAIAHLGALRRTLLHTPLSFLDGLPFPLERRMVPLSYDDITLMERWSFRRPPGGKILVRSRYIREDSLWSDVFPTGDGYYMDWVVSKLTPAFYQPELILLCIENNDRKEPGFSFNVGLATVAEYRSLIEELTRGRKARPIPPSFNHILRWDTPEGDLTGDIDLDRMALVR